MFSIVKMGKVAGVTLLALMGTAAMAQGSPIVVEVKDTSGRLLSDARVTLIGPERAVARSVVLQTDRLGIATFNGNPAGRYMVVATKQDYQLQLRELTVSDSRPGNVELRLGANTSERIVVSARSADTNEAINGATIRIFQGANQNSQSLTTRGNGTATVSTHTNPTARYMVEITHPNFETASVIVQSNAGMDRFTTFTLRRRTSGQPTQPTQSRTSANLHGDIRMPKTRVKSGEIATADVGIFYSDSTSTSLSANVSVNVYGPSGRVVARDNYVSNLLLNTPSRRSLDISTSEPGTYTVRATATGNGMRSWTADKTFTVDRQVAGPIVPEGIYNGTIDLTTIDGQVQTHTMSIKISKKSGNLYDVVGSLGPGQADGFHIKFTGTFDPRRGNLNATGEYVDTTDKRWDIRLSGPINQAGRLQLNLSIRANDNSYNRSARTQLTKN